MQQKLEEIKSIVSELDPDLDPGGPEFRTAVIVMAAAVVVGPQVDRLVQFTGYSVMFVADIAQRMRAHGLWSDHEVCADYRLDDDRGKGEFFLHCLVAEGVMQVNRTEDGKVLFSEIDPESTTWN